MSWVTNDPQAAKLLKAADAAYERAKAKATDLPLAQKIVALRVAKQIREAAYKVAGDLGERATDHEIREDLRDQIANTGDC